MLKRKNLVHRTYEDKECVSFFVKIPYEEGVRPLDAMFKREPGTKDEWQMIVSYPRTEYADSQCYMFYFKVPSTTMSIELIAASALLYFQTTLKNEIQQKIDTNITLIQMLKDM